MQRNSRVIDSNSDEPDQWQKQFGEPFGDVYRKLELAGGMKPVPLEQLLNRQPEE